MREKLERAAFLLAGHLKKGQRVGLGSSDLQVYIVKELKRRRIEEGLEVELVPATTSVANLLYEYKMPIGELGAKDLDVTIEFADRIDSNLDFVKTKTHSLVRDKTLAMSSRHVFVVSLHDKVSESLHGLTPFEVNPFGLPHTMKALSRFGAAFVLTDEERKKVTTEDSNYVAMVDVAREFDLLDVDEVARKIPAVLETGVFPHLADVVALVGKDVAIMQA
ncbi:MAG TPA: ribose-5-phosphate isomerase A [archaeon]|nr:ribose-5-phosphate isomerase A [archaeon]